MPFKSRCWEAHDTEPTTFRDFVVDHRAVEATSCFPDSRNDLVSFLLECLGSLSAASVPAGDLKQECCAVLELAETLVPVPGPWACLPYRLLYPQLRWHLDRAELVPIVG